MLRVDRLTYEIKNRTLIKGLSFQVRKGELIAILGANGAGKSTLMKLLSGEVKPTEGNVLLHGKSIAAYSGRELALQRAVLVQQQQVNLAFTVHELVIMGRYPHFRTSPTAHDLDIVKEAMQICGVLDFQDREYLSLSGGEQQRVQLARVLAQIWDNPDALLLLDEPVSALDLQFQQRVLAIAKAFTKRGFMAVVVLHDVNMAATYADRIIMLKNGRKWADGTPVEVLNKSDIYAIFTVDSTVEIDPATLRPNVKLKEVNLDIDAFNSKLPKKNARHDLELFTHGKKPESTFFGCTAQRTDSPRLHFLLAQRTNKITFLKTDIHTLFRQLFRVNYIDATIQLAACMQKIRMRITPDIQIDKLLLDNDIAFLRADSQHIAFAIGLENEQQYAFMFFDARGNYLFEIGLDEQRSDLEQFRAIVQEFSDNTTVFDAGMSACAAGDTEQKPDLQKLHPAAAQQRFDAVKKILARHATQHIPLCITLVNELTQLRYTGTISNLIDQGDRYMIYDSCYQMRLAVGGIGHIELVDVSDDQQDIHIFDGDGNLFLKLNGLSQDDLPLELDTLLDRYS